MSRPSLEVLVRPVEGATGQTLVAAPAIGRVRFLRRVGEALTGGSRLALFVRGGKTVDLCLPRGSGGVIEELLLEDPVVPCEYGAPLCRLAPVSAASAGDAEGESTAAEAAAGFELRSPTHGTFYRRPSPDAPAYVETGAVVTRGQTLGLVEVMKCFSPITFEPPAGTESGKVLGFEANDGEEVRAEQALVRIAID